MQNKLWLGTTCFLGLLCLCGAAFVYQLQDVFDHNDDELLVERGENVYFEVDGISYSEPETYAVKFSITPLHQDFSTLPDLTETAPTKQFFESLYKLAYLGQNEEFQQNLKKIKTEQILANLMLTKNDLVFLNTSQLTTNMLRFQQIQDSIALAYQLMHDLRFMVENYDCTVAQTQLINISAAHLTYLIRNFRVELDNFILPDPFLVRSLDPIYHERNLIEIRNKQLQENAQQDLEQEHSNSPNSSAQAS